MRNAQVQVDRIRTIHFDVWKLFAFLKALVQGSRLYLYLSILSILLAGALAVVAQLTSKDVLVLSGGPGHSVSIDLMEATLRSHVPWPVKFSAASDLEDPPFDKEPYQEKLAEALRRGFSKKPDLVIAVMDPSLRFALKYRDKTFPNVPIVFMSISSPKAGQRMFQWPGVTGVVSAVGVQETIDLALRLHPDTDAIAVITNVSATENDYFAAVHDELLRHQNKVKEIDLIGPPTGELLAQVDALPPHTVVLFQLWPHDSDLSTVNAFAAAVAARLPTYCIFTGLCLGQGGIGGAYTDPRNDAILTGELAARVLNGERPENIALAHNSSLQVEVDWRALQRWHIPKSALPVGSVILYRPPSLWEQYRNYVIVAAGVITALLLLLIALLWERSGKRKAEAVLRESEERFRVMANTTPSLVWMCDPQGRIIYLNERRIVFTGPDPNAGYGNSWIEYVHPDDRRNVKDVVAQALEDGKPFSNEYRLRRSDGVYRWMFDVASPRLNGDGSFAGFIGSAIDITDQKIAHQALEKVSGQLIEAQENERRRIARDLHDDICQRLAILSMELDQANKSANETSGATKQRLREIRQHCSQIAGDVQSLSHELHSSKLDYLGIVTALRGFCHEFSKQHEVNIGFTNRDVPADLPRDISLCLFRVAQEALHNAAKYSGVRQYAVELSASAEEIELAVSDSGRGFDVDAAKKNRGLGLVSMQERVHLVHGSFLVESKPGRGTRIFAVVPLVHKTLQFSQDGVVEQPERA